MEVIRTALRLQSAAVLLIALGAAMIFDSQQTDKAPPKELIQFIHEAKQRGEQESKIKQQAVAVGWPAASVEEALAYEKSGKPSEPADLPAEEAAPQKPAP